MGKKTKKKTILGIILVFLTLSLTFGLLPPTLAYGQNCSQSTTFDCLDWVPRPSGYTTDVYYDDLTGTGWHISGNSGGGPVSPWNLNNAFGYDWNIALLYLMTQVWQDPSGSVSSSTIHVGANWQTTYPDTYGGGCSMGAGSYCKIYLNINGTDVDSQIANYPNTYTLGVFKYACEKTFDLSNYFSEGQLCDFTIRVEYNIQVIHWYIVWILWPWYYYWASQYVDYVYGSHVISFTNWYYFVP